MSREIPTGDNIFALLRSRETEEVLLFGAGEQVQRRSDPGSHRFLAKQKKGVHRISTENAVCDQGWMQQRTVESHDLMLMVFHGALRQHKSESTPLRFAVTFAVNDAFRQKGKRPQERLEWA